MSDENSFGSMLNTARRRMGWTQQEVADKFDHQVSRVTVNRWENDLQLPSAYNLKQLVVILGLNENEADALYRAAAQMPPEIENFPFQRNPFFTGREEHLEQLRKLLQETGIAEITQPISISGLGGIGKTELALEYAHRSYPKVYRAVFWVNAADKAALQASYDSLAQLLELPEGNEQELDRRIQAVKRWLATHTNWLLIMDNADDLPLARSFLPAKPLGHVVFTTRSQIIGTIARRARQIEIEAMVPPEGLVLLLLRSRVLEDETKLDTVATGIRETALEVVKLLGGHPLALDQAGAYIEDTGVSFTDYIKRCQDERSYLLNRRGSQVSEYSEHPEYSKHPETVAVTFELSFKNACEQHPIARDILHFCAFLHPDAIPDELFQHDDSFKYGTTAFDEGIAALHRYSLIKRNMQEKTFSMHRLVQAVLIDAMSTDLQMQCRERVVRALDASFPAGGFKEWARWGRMLPHALVCATWTNDEIGPGPIVEVLTLFDKACVCLLDVPLSNSKAEPLQAKALSICEQLFGVEHPFTARCLHILAVHYLGLGMGELAEPLLVQSLSIQEEVLKVKHPASVISLYPYSIFQLASLYLHRREFEQVESLYQRELAICEKHYGVEDPNIVNSLDKLARFYHSLRKYEQAELFYRRELRILENHPEAGPFYPSLTQPLVWLAKLMQDQAQHEQAEVFYQRARSIEEKQFGPKHLVTQATKRSYAHFLYSMGRDAEAAALEVNDEQPSV